MTRRNDSGTGTQSGNLYETGAPSRRNESARGEPTSDRKEDPATPQKPRVADVGTEDGAYGPVFLASGSQRKEGEDGEGPHWVPASAERGQGDTSTHSYYHSICTHIYIYIFIHIYSRSQKFTNIYFEYFVGIINLLTVNKFYKKIHIVLDNAHTW